MLVTAVGFKGKNVGKRKLQNFANYAVMNIDPIPLYPRLFWNMSLSNEHVCTAFKVGSSCKFWSPFHHDRRTIDIYQKKSNKLISQTPNGASTVTNTANDAPKSGLR